MMRRVCRLVMACSVMGLLACAGAHGPAASQASLTSLDALTQPEPSAQRQRAMRRLQLASAYFEQGQHDVALKEVRAAIELDPSFAQSYNLLGLIHQRLNAPQSAKSSFDQAMALVSAPGESASELASVAHNYGWFLCEQNQYDSGQAMLQRALAQPGYRQVVSTWLVLGDCQRRAGQLVQAEQSWRHALSIEPHNPWLKQRLSLPEMQKSTPQS